MLNVKIDECDALEQLCERVKVWRDGDVADLFFKMYENLVNSGAYNYGVFDVKSIVDNDIVNWCSVVEKGEKDFKKLLNLYKQGEYDVSCEDFEEYKVSYIEAVSDNEDLILIRY